MDCIAIPQCIVNVFVYRNIFIKNKLSLKGYTMDNNSLKLFFGKLFLIQKLFLLNLQCSLKE